MQVGAGQVRPVKARLSQVRISKVRRVEVYQVEVRAVEVRRHEVRTSEIRMEEVCPGDGRPMEVRLAKVLPYVRMIFPPAVPGLDAPLQDGKMFGVSHESSMPAFRRRAIAFFRGFRGICV